MSSTGTNNETAAAGYTFPTIRSKHILDSESTDAQTAAEAECAPFFVELQTLSDGQLDHLRGVGLLPPLLPTTAMEVIGGKAAKILGVMEDNVSEIGRPKIELLEEATQDESSSLNEGSDSNGSSNHDVNTNSSFDPYAIRLLREAHSSYLLKALSKSLPRGFVSLDSSHPWMVYWCLHSLDLLGHFDITHDDAKECSGLETSGYDALKDVEVMQKGHLLQRIVSTLEHCWSDVPVEFNVEEVHKDARLKQLYDDQNGNSNKGKGEKVSIVGGGFGGGPQQMPHCAPTYAAVLSLCIVASLGFEQPSSHPYHEAGQMAMEVLKTRKLQLYAFFLTLREYESGDIGEEERIAFRMQHDGEIDVRASYCILAPCYLLGLLNNINSNTETSDENNRLLSTSISRYIASCQTFEGGFGAEPFNEAHGGYTFCALAALRILNTVSMVDVNALSSWLARRQMGFEGGFCGRTNKLVDGCYSFWQGGAVAVFDGWHNNDENDDDTTSKEGLSEKSSELSYDEMMLQRYILLCAQDVNGGLRDKPSKPKDFYHSCYNLSGLSVAQHALEPWPPSPKKTTGDEGKEEQFNLLFGDANVNIIGRTDPVINIRVERVKFMLSSQF